MTHQTRTVLGAVALATFEAPGPAAARPAAAATAQAQPYAYGMPPPPPPRYEAPAAGRTAAGLDQRQARRDAWLHHNAPDGGIARVESDHLRHTRREHAGQVGTR
jgi:hypothetical protein